MIKSACTIAPVRFKRQRHTPAQRAGLSYERSFVKALGSSTPVGFEIESGVWFEYQRIDLKYPLPCCPDALLFDMDEGFIIVIEVKLTWTPLALQKLKDLYCPVVQAAFGGIPARPLVVCKNLIPGAPRPQPSLSFSFIADNPLFQWLGTEPLRW